MGRKTLDRQVRYALSQKMQIGVRRHAAKAKLRAELGSEYHFETAVTGIHSFETRVTYEKACLCFAKWCVEKQFVNRYEKLENVRHLVEPFIQHRMNSGMSIFTLKMERSALSKLYGETVDFALPARTPDKITRSRNATKMDKHFSEKRNADLIVIAKATGGRRGDVANMRVSDFVEIGGVPVVRIDKSKGGRNRIAPILPSKEQDIARIVADTKAAGHERLFERVHTKADVHGFRREYAQELYKAVAADPKLRSRLLAFYRPRWEDVAGDYYTTRRRNTPNKTFLRDNLYVVSQALGHNRLEVTTTHYLL